MSAYLGYATQTPGGRHRLHGCLAEKLLNILAFMGYNRLSTHDGTSPAGFLISTSYSHAVHSKFLLQLR